MAMAVMGRPGAVPSDRTGATAQRTFLFDELFSKKYDESILDAPAPPRGRLARAVPAWLRVASEVHRRRDEYDVVVSWSERVSLSLMTLQGLSRRGPPHIAMMYWFSRPSVRLPMRAFARDLHAIVTWSSVQRRYAIEHFGIAPEKIYLVRHFVDQVFWSPPGERQGVAPHDVEVDTICSAGAEMRDYPTLLEALRGTDLRCHIAADHVRVDRWGFARRVSTEDFARLAGKHVTIGRLPAVGLRDLYARSRFVVVPLQRSDTDNGVSNT